MDKKRFLILLFSTLTVVFLAAFIAFYTVFENTKENSEPNLNEQELSSVEELSKEESKELEEMDKNFEHEQKFVQSTPGFIFMSNNGPSITNPPIIKTEEKNNTYKITVDLKPFGGNEGNVKTKIKDKTIKISAEYKSKQHGKFNSSKIYQTFVLPYKIDKNSITKAQKGDFLVITVKKKEKD